MYVSVLVKQGFGWAVFVRFRVFCVAFQFQWPIKNKYKNENENENAMFILKSVLDFAV